MAALLLMPLPTKLAARRQIVSCRFSPALSRAISAPQSAGSAAPSPVSAVFSLSCRACGFQRSERGIEIDLAVGVERCNLA